MEWINGWWFGTREFYDFILGMSSSQLTNSYFSEGLKPPTRWNLMGFKWILGDFTMVQWGCMRD
jgi:hypothetical protein